MYLEFFSELYGVLLESVIFINIVRVNWIKDVEVGTDKPSIIKYQCKEYSGKERLLSVQ